jgi:hypothetical protein
MPVSHKALQPIDIIESPIQLNQCPFLLFRFYGPTEPLFNKTFILNDVELVK